MSAQRQIVARVPLRARPKPDLDMKAVREEISKRYEKTLEYLGR
jgi:hypothetical protein